MRTKEKRFIRSCLLSLFGQGGPMDAGGLDWEAVDGEARLNGVHCLAHKAVKESGLHGVPRGTMEQWAKARENTLALNLAYQAELKKILRRYDGGDLAVLKGGALLYSVYGDWSLRPQSDLDLLVRPENMDKLSGLLRAMGYAPDSFHPGRFLKPPLVLDAHTDLLDASRIKSRAYLLSGRPAPVFVPVPDESGLLMLSREDALFYHALHAAKHSFLRWIWLYDAALMAGPGEKPFPERPVSWLFQAMHGVLGLDYGTVPLGFIERKVMARVGEDDKIDGSGELLFMSMIKGPWRKMAFIAEVLFLRPSVLKQTYHIRYGFLVPIYYIRRMFDLLRNIFL